MTAGFETLDFHRIELPRGLNAGKGGIAARDAEKQGVLAIPLEEGVETAPVPAEPGGVTIHYGDGTHAAPPPAGSKGPFRSSVLVAFHQLECEHHCGDDHTDDVVLKSADGQVDDLKAVVART